MTQEYCGDSNAAFCHRLHCYKCLPDYLLRHRNAYLGLLEHGDPLLHGEPLPPHPNLLAFGSHLVGKYRG